ncbi:hypothetical protein V6N11_080015 [Hibiscus sabdariffa]|uniref:Uncharacterized protein n=1 Tax=Hibiscus sabdariffa TaxID=183260 RepID=A0ABR2RX43_9ROSI
MVLAMSQGASGVDIGITNDPKGGGGGLASECKRRLAPNNPSNSAMLRRHMKTPVASCCIGPSPKQIHLISCEPMTHVSDIKLISTDTTLDLGQKAEKGILLKVEGSACNLPVALANVETTVRHFLACTKALVESNNRR